MTIMNRSTIGTEIPIPHYFWSTCAGSDNMGKRIVMRLTQNRCEEVFFSPIDYTELPDLTLYHSPATPSPFPCVIWCLPY